MTIKYQELIKPTWEPEDYQEFVELLESLADDYYRDFSLKFISSKYTLLGIRIPELRAMAKSIRKGNYYDFLQYEPETIEAIYVFGFVIATLPDDEIMDYFERYLSYVDNWATCDSFCSTMKNVPKNPKHWWKIVMGLIVSKREYDVRVGLVLIKNYFLLDDYIDGILAIFEGLQREEYTVKMAMAWTIAEAASKYPEKIVRFLSDCDLDRELISMTRSKIFSSRRVDERLKKALKAK